MKRILPILALCLPFGLFSQNAIVGSGFSTGWGGLSCPTGNAHFTFFSSSAGTSFTSGTLTPNGTGNQYWRFGVDWDGTTAQLTTTHGSDQALTPKTEYSLNTGCTTFGAMFRNVSSSTNRYVFKTQDAGPTPTGNFIFFEIGGDVRTISSVSQNPSSTVYRNQSVVVTASMSGSLNSGQGVYLRYSTDNFSTSTITEMTLASGSDYEATIPAITNAAGNNVTYYIFTSGDGMTIDPSDADFYTINLNNNGGSNYSYSVNSSFTTSSSGDWSTAANWPNNVSPTNGSSVVLQHDVTLDQDVELSSLNINSGITFTASDGTPRTLTISRSASGKATTITNSGGTWANGTGGSTVVFSGAPSSGDAIHATSGALGFQNVTINKTGGTSNVGVDFTANSSVSGTLQIGEGGFVSTAPPASFYGTSAILQFNQGASGAYGVNPGDYTWSSTEVPNNITVSSGNVTLYTDRTATGDLIVADGAQLVLTANVELEVNGTLDLGGDIDLLAANNGYSQLKVDGAITDNGGAVRVQQYVATAGWHNVAIPVTGNLNLLGAVNTAIHPNTRNVYTWNETSGQWVDVAGATNGSAVANSAGTGYLVYVGTNGVINSATNFDVTGDLFGNTTPSLTNAGSGDDAGWNLVGNPFPCGINFFSLSLNNVTNGYSIWNPGSSSYTAYTDLSPGNPRIPPMQGFWVQATGGSPNIGTISMSANCDVANVSAFLKTQTVVADRLFINTYEAADPSKRDEFLLGMVAGTHDGLDNAWDIGKRLNASTVPSLMSVAGSDELAINAIDYSPNSIRTKKLQLRFVSGKQNEVYFIELHDSLLSNNYHIELEDLKLRRKHNLNNAPYKFVHDQNAEYRFVLHISPVTTINQGHTHTPIVNGGVNVGINGGTLVLKMDAPQQDVQGALLDLNGRRVMEVEYPAGVEQHLLDVSSLAKGIYLLQLQSASGEEVHKIILP